MKNLTESQIDRRYWIMSAIMAAFGIAVAVATGAEPETPVVNINEAGIEELCHLPGVGEYTAHRIGEFVLEYGPVTDPAHLIHVKGIGEKTLAKMLPFIAVEGPTTAKEKIKPLD